MKNLASLVILTFYFSSFAFAQTNTIEWHNAKWIGYSNDKRSEKWSARTIHYDKLDNGRKKSFVSPFLRKNFVIDKTVASAEIAVCGLGLYELYLNGKKVGDRVLDPAQTSYEKRAFYVVHDLKKLLKKDKNTVGLMLGSGFFGQSTAFKANLSYGCPRAIVVLKITYTDGTTENIVSDQSWKATGSPILFDNIFLGETYDARMNIEDWSTPEYDDSKWTQAELLPNPTKKLIEQKMEPMRKIRKVLPVAVFKADSGWVVDLGQNMTGWLQINVKEKEGTVIKMRFAELLMPDKKNIDPASTGVHVTGDVQTDIYICSGKGNEVWEPRFTYHGFRYVQIEGISEKPDIKDFTGWLVRTDAPRIGSFKCSDELINTFYDVSMWTIEDNIQGILTDCPHRERCAWMGDTYAVAEAASYNFNLQKFWQKTAADIETTLGKSAPHKGDSLSRDSRAPCNVGVGKRLCLQARPDWGAATVMVPWFSYLHYGDTGIVKDNWVMMANWMNYLDEKVVKDGIIKQGYGDWCPPGSNKKMDTSPSFTSTALYYQSLVAMQKMASALDKTKEISEYAKRAKVVKAAFNKKFFDSNSNNYGSQTANSFALFSHLVPTDKEQAVANSLADLIMEKNGGHYTTGIFGHRPLYTVLNDYGHANVTRHLWNITDFPSLGFLTEKHNLTTWPETPYNWEKGKRYRRNSFNHPMHSGFAATFHESLGGIRPDVENPGFKKFFLKPTFIPDLKWVEVSHQSPYGKILSSWKRNEEAVVWTVTVPDNTTAQVQLLAYKAEQIKLDAKVVKTNTFTLSSGTYKISIDKIRGY